MDLFSNCRVPREYSRRGRVTEFSRLKASEWMHMCRGLRPDIAELLLSKGR